MQQASFRRIDVTAARGIIGRGRALVIDVRDPEFFARGHIDGAELASRENISSFVTLTPKDRPVVFCCYHGNSSQAYAKYFAEQGFADVYSLDGGYEAWALAERTAPGARRAEPGAGSLSRRARLCARRRQWPQQGQCDAADGRRAPRPAGAGRRAASPPAPIFMRPMSTAIRRSGSPASARSRRISRCWSAPGSTFSTLM